jgi:hypothetical protein
MEEPRDDAGRYGVIVGEQGQQFGKFRLDDLR